MVRAYIGQSSGCSTHLTGQGRELEYMHSFVIDRGIVGDVDDHGDLALPNALPLPHKVVLEEPR